MMRIRFARKRAAVPLIVVIAVTVAAIIFCVWFMLHITADGHGIRMMFVAESQSRGYWSCHYRSCNGQQEKRFYPTGARLHIETETESGSLSIEVRDEDGAVIFQKEDVGTDTYHVDVSGPVTIGIKAEDHRGGFVFTSCDP